MTKIRMRDAGGTFAVEHGESNRSITPEYRAWKQMLRRCHTSTSTSYAYYGGRGIRVCRRWRDSYETFLADVGRRPSSEHSLDRRDNNGHYEPRNVRWATRSEQAQNKRTAHVIIWQGKSACLAEWSRRTGIPRGTLLLRLRHGWTVGRAFSTPVLTWSQAARRKLDEEKVDQIQSMLHSKSGTQRDIANVFGVDPSLISRIACGECWKDGRQ